MEKEFDVSALPMMAMDEVPTPNENAQRITALVKERGAIVGYQMENGSILTKEEALQSARQGGILGVGIAHNKGTEYLKSLPDDTESNNLDNLPSISK